MDRSSYVKFSALAALKVVILTTFSAASDEDFIKMKTFPFQCICTNTELLSNGPLGTIFGEILIKIQNFSFTKLHTNISPAKWRPWNTYSAEISRVDKSLPARLKKVTTCHPLSNTNWFPTFQIIRKMQKTSCMILNGLSSTYILKDADFEVHYLVYFPFKMMTSSSGNIFRVTGHLCQESTGHRWIPRTKASDAELWCFLRSTPE